MNLVPAAITTKIARNTLLLQKNSPGILFGAGVVGVVGSTVLACRATLKMDAVLEEAQAKIKLTEETLSDHTLPYVPSDQKHDIRVIRIQTGVKIVKLYAPAIVVGGLSIAALTSSHRILSTRNAALTAAYAALEKGFEQYRARVVEKYGEDQDQQFRYGTRQVEVVDPDDHRKKKTLTRVGPEAASVYARFFDQLCQDWSPDPEFNKIFLKCQQNWANDMLRARGHLFLNEVYDHLGLPRSKAGSVVGWLLSKNGETDNYVSFGIFEGQDQQIRDFVNGHEGSVLLDFNVDGPIWNQIEEIGEELSWQQGH